MQMLVLECMHTSSVHFIKPLTLFILCFSFTYTKVMLSFCFQENITKLDNAISDMTSHFMETALKTYPFFYMGHRNSHELFHAIKTLFIVVTLCLKLIMHTR